MAENLHFSELEREAHEDNNETISKHQSLEESKEQMSQREQQAEELVEAVPKPQSAYILFIQDLKKQDKENEKNGTSQGIDKRNYLSEASKMWNQLDEQAKARYQEKSARQRQAYNKYLASKGAIREEEQEEDNEDAMNQKRRLTQLPVARVRQIIQLDGSQNS